MTEEERCLYCSMDEFRKQWEEVRVCAELIRQGRAQVMIRRRPGGRKHRYTRVGRDK